MFLLINKPVGWTSFDAVNHIRRRMSDVGGRISDVGYRRPDAKNPPVSKLRVGHAGTLDPFAAGLLIVAVGREDTKRLDEFKKLPKTYIAGMRLGASSDTDDLTGKIQETKNARPPERETVAAVLKNFVGKQLQLPPMHSAKKIAGQRLYQLARRGKTVERKPSAIEIYSIVLLDYTWPILKIEVVCSAGTYIRALARDIGEKLGVGAFCETLVRTNIGPHTLQQAATVDDPKLGHKSGLFDRSAHL